MTSSFNIYYYFCMYIIVCKFVYPVVTQDNKEDEEERERESQSK